MGRILHLWRLTPALVMLALPVVSAQADDAPPLSTYNADINDSSISGISSGGFMAVQFATAWSSIIKGVGVVAGGPYSCARGGGDYGSFLAFSILQAVGPCMTNTPSPDLAPLLANAEDFQRRGMIDALDNLRTQKVYLFSGYNDQVVNTGVVDVTRDFYLHYLGDAGRGNLFYQRSIGAGHSQVTLNYGDTCSANKGDYIDNCGYDQAGIILQHIYGRLNPRNPGKLTGHLKPYSQAAFTSFLRPIDISMSDNGYVYVPAGCDQQQRCRVHIALHGCLQTADLIGDHYVAHAGYNEWADTNNIIVLYPQTRKSTLMPLNPQACWDWFGYTNDRYATRDEISRQIGAIKGMLDRVTQGVQPAAAGALSNDPVPANLVATDSSEKGMALAWSAVTGADAYNVYRAAPGEDFVLAGGVIGPSFGDTGLIPATSYSYKVAGVTGGTEGPASAVVKGTTRSIPAACHNPGSCPVR
jgi:Esterase PHB depolymerase